MKDMDYYLDPEHAEEWEKLTPEEQSEVTMAAFTDPDNSGYVSEEQTVEDDGEKDQGPSEEQSVSEDGQEASEEEGDAPTGDEKPVIQAKDGKNVIPYERLEEATERMNEALEKAANLEKMVNEQTSLINDLKTAAEKDASAGEETTDAQDAVLAEYAGEYPEMMEDIRPYLEAKIQEGVISKIGDIKSELDTLKEAVTSVKEITKQVEDDKKAIAAQDAQEWATAQDKFWEVSENQVFHKSNNPALFNLLNDEVVRLANNTNLGYDELLVTAKENVTKNVSVLTGVKPATKEQDPAKKVDAKEKLKEAENKTEVPATMSDIPGSTAVHTDEAEAALNMTMRQASTMFANMTPDQIEAKFQKIGL